MITITSALTADGCDVIASLPVAAAGAWSRLPKAERPIPERLMPRWPSPVTCYLPLTFAPLHRPEADLHFCTMMCRAFGASHHLPRGFEIFSGIDGDGMIIGDDGLEGEAVGEETELLE